ncbi:hypothetical protein ACKRZS_012982 [Fusarium odoratissimum]
MPATLPSPPKSNPSPVPDPGDEDSNDDDASTKEAKSTVTTTGPVSTAESTTITSAKSTSEITTSETTAECTVTEIPQCTKTISYITMSQSVTITEIGECPSTPSCATGEQSTVTTTLKPESYWVGYVADPQQGPSEAELDAPVDEETEEYLEEFFREHDLLLDYETEDASPECSNAFSALATATTLTASDSTEATTTSSDSAASTTEEATTAKIATCTSEERTSSTEEADATPAIDPNYQPVVQQDPECLKLTGGDHGAIDPGTQDDYAEEFSSQGPDGGWEAGPDIQHSYKETSHGVVYEYNVNWAQDCTTDGDTQDVRWPLGQSGDVTTYSLMRGAFEKCNFTSPNKKCHTNSEPGNNGGIGGSIQAGCLVYTFNGYDE